MKTRIDLIRLFLVLGLVLGLGVFAAPSLSAPPEQTPVAPAPLDVVKWEYPPSFGGVTINLVGDAGHNRSQPEAI